jgi:outer membrane receptor protein involved in Fe transport
MKAHIFLNRTSAIRAGSKVHTERTYRAAIYLASLACGGVALAQTNNPPAAPAPPASDSSTNVTKLENMTVFGKLDVARNQIVPDLGATVYEISKAQIEALPQGANASFNQVLLRAPGMAQDSAANGDLHLRGEHANIQYRINDVLLPEGITGFGQELDTRFVESLRLITGSLPAQYGFRTAGVVDLRTKSGAFEPGGSATVYGGSYDTIKPSLEYGGATGKWNYFADGSFTHDAIGIENPTPSSSPIHDITDQYKAFTYLSYLFDETSRISVMGSASYSDFQVPNTPGLPPGTSPNGNPWLPGNFDSANLNENQNEQNYYGVAAYQKSAGDLNLQVAAFGRVSTVHFTPDPIGDLFFNGVASDVSRKLYTGGIQADASYNLGEKHTVRGGIMVLDEAVSADTTTGVFPVDANGDPTGPAFSILDNHVSHAIFAGLYLQDEWKLLPKLTLNYGARFDVFYASFDKENQPSPRVNLIYEPTDTTTLHAGYARYFTPPPLENIPPSTVTEFNGTSNASATTQADPVQAERANYFDAGITQKLVPGLQVGLDGYYKNAVNQLDDGLFGQTLILSAFNYAEGRVYGGEFTATYTKEGFSAFANVAYSVAEGKQWKSAQFLFAPDEAAYVQQHWISLDHDQRVTGSFGASYLWKETDRSSTRVFVDALYGSGLRTGATAPDGSSIPNGGTVPAYYTVSLGAEQSFKITAKQHLKARLDVVNVTDNVYELRNGTGVGVNAAQFGMRLGVFGTLSYVF